MTTPKNTTEQLETTLNNALNHFFNGVQDVDISKSGISAHDLVIDFNSTRRDFTGWISRGKSAKICPNISVSDLVIPSPQYLTDKCQAVKDFISRCDALGVKAEIDTDKTVRNRRDQFISKMTFKTSIS